MVLAWRRLRIHHRDHRSSFTKFAGKLAWTFTIVGVNAVDTDTAILTHVIFTVVNILRAINAAEAWLALAGVVRKVINAFRSIGAWIEFSATELNFFLTKLAVEASKTTARVALNAIDTCSVVLAFMILAIINIDFTSCTFIACQTITAKATLLENTTSSIISARITITCIYHILTMHSMIAGSATTFVLLFRPHNTFGIILAWECETGITFRQNLITDFLFADELICRRRENKFVLHSLRLGASCNTRLNIIQFHPFRKPFQRAIAV